MFATEQMEWLRALERWSTRLSFQRKGSVGVDQEFQPYPRLLMPENMLKLIPHLAGLTRGIDQTSGNKQQF